MNAVISGGVRFISPDVNAPAETSGATRWLCVPE
jgi:hypothetical protein